MSRRIVHTDKAPAALGPYSQAVVAAGFVHCSGQIAIDPAVGEVVPGGVEAETHQVFANLAAVLAEAGSSLASAVRCTVFLRDMNDFAKVNAVYAEYFSGDSSPARATVQVSRLPKDVAVEIDCIALVD